jgi:Phosphatidyl serine synthase
MVRPHPAVWRFIHGVLMAYLLLLVFLLFQDVGYARQFLRVSTTRTTSRVASAVAQQAFRTLHSLVSLHTCSVCTHVLC